MKQIVRNIVRLGSGEALARIAGITVVLLLARGNGVVFVGVYALAQSMAQYSVPLIDFGLRHVGARLVAQYPQSAAEIVRRVQQRRILMALALLPFLLLYATFTNLPWDMKTALMAFAVLCVFYSFSLDWLAWGKEHLRLVGLGKAIIPCAILAGLLLGRGSPNVLWWLVAGNLAGALLQTGIFWGWWNGQKPRAEEAAALTVMDHHLAWQRTSIMGLAWLGNVAFNCIDLMMLGIMSNAHEVGLYSASYRVITQFLYTYYLLTQVLYPRLARQNLAQRINMLRPQIFILLSASGLAIAIGLVFFRQPVLALVFGRQFLPAAPLLLLLAWAIPLDFLTSYLSNAYIAWGMERKILFCTLISAGCNVILNLFGIPRYGASAAAANTLISYVIFLATLAVAGRSAKELNSQAEAASI